ncbi:MAG: acyl-CoA dehydrogenase family protein [Mycobacteriales bacterium]
MDFAFSAEQDMLRTAARDYLADRFPIERVVELAQGDPGWDPASWQQLADLGWLGLSVAEEHGGAGMSLLDEAVLLEEAGSALYPGPLFSTVALALPALEAAYADVPSALDAVTSGGRSATMAWAEGSSRPTITDTTSVSCTASRDGALWRLSGTKRFVPDLALADDVVVIATSADGVGLWLVDLRAEPTCVLTRSTMDTTRRLGDLVLDATPATLLVIGDRVEPLLRTIRRRALAALACEAVGVAQRALDISAAYAGQREQFGRRIGTYQGVSHRIANIYVSLQLARSLAYWAAWAVATDDEQADVACAAASSASGEAAVFACENAIQSMGGIGFTWDHPLHRFYKRAQWIEAFEGFGREHRSELAGVLLDA